MKKEISIGQKIITEYKPNNAMKTLQKFADNYAFTIVPIRYTYQGIRVKRKGFDLIDRGRQIHLSFEPTHYSNGDKWLVKNYCQGGVMYAKNIPDAIKKLKEYGFWPVMHTGMSLK
jgi:hypothetical protein